ncbi:unnamed protein product [Linum trigynum]|uniref:Chlororespiratory reduction 4 n=1 Tax=Linum trigynum TaxID=586398 RepID=A0AAV2F3A5_9ROSI
MRGFYLKSLKFGGSRISIAVGVNVNLLRLFGSQPVSRYPTFTTSGYQLLQCLSKHRIYDARNLLDEMLPGGTSRSRTVYCTSLVTKFSRSGFVDEARLLFDIMPAERNVVTYNAMLSGYVQCGRLKEAMALFREMPERNVISWTSMLSGLADAGRIDEAKLLFVNMTEKNVVSWNAMVVGLIRNADLENARLVFDKMPVKNVASWNAMIAGYADIGRIEEARTLFDMMPDPNALTWTSMVSGYCRVGEVAEGYNMFQRIRDRNVISWTSMISGFTWNGFYEEALLLFLEMNRTSGVAPNSETLISLAYACAGLRFSELGRQVHAQMLIQAMQCDDYDGRIAKSLIYMYSSFGTMPSAQYLFDNFSDDSVLQSYNCLINGYVRVGDLEKARILFDAAPSRDKITWTSIISGYFSVGLVLQACHLFHYMPFKDEIAWTTMITGHIQNELFDEAMHFFLEMRTFGVIPLSTTYTVLFGAVGAMAYLDHGRSLHGMIIKTQPGFDLILENSVVSMYAKCGELRDACKIFSRMTSRDDISWNSMIMGFAHHGLANEALQVFEAMMESRTRPNSLTFLAVLSACSHAGLLDKGLELFTLMTDVHGIQPGLEHCISVVNILGRAGKFEEAEKFIAGLPFHRHPAMLGAILGVSGPDKRSLGIAERSGKLLLEIDPMNASAHVHLCNLYASNHHHLKEYKLRREMVVKGVKKVPGCSWIVLSGKVHMFLCGDSLNPEAEELLISMSNSCCG